MKLRTLRRNRTGRVVRACETRRVYFKWGFAPARRKLMVTYPQPRLPRRWFFEFDDPGDGGEAFSLALKRSTLFLGDVVGSITVKPPSTGFTERQAAGYRK